MKKYLTESFIKNEAAARLFASNVLPDELFLTSGFKSLISPGLSSRIIAWFDRRLIIIYRADQITTTAKVDDTPAKSAYIEETIDEAAKIFGVSSNELGYIKPKGEPESRLCSIFKDPEGKSGHALSAEDYESYGTIRFINLFPLIALAIKLEAFWWWMNSTPLFTPWAS